MQDNGEYTQEDSIWDQANLAFTSIAAASCASTVDGWIWYCDEHDTHGNADSEDEARYMVKAHYKYMKSMKEHWLCKGGMYVVSGKKEVATDD